MKTKVGQIVQLTVILLEPDQLKDIASAIYVEKLLVVSAVITKVNKIDAGEGWEPKLTADLHVFWPTSHRFHVYNEFRIKRGIVTIPEYEKFLNRDIENVEESEFGAGIEESVGKFSVF